MALAVAFTTLAQARLFLSRRMRAFKTDPAADYPIAGGAVFISARRVGQGMAARFAVTSHMYMNGLWNLIEHKASSEQSHIVCAFRCLTHPPALAALQQPQFHEASPDLDAIFDRLQASGAEVVHEPTVQPYGATARSAIPPAITSASTKCAEAFAFDVSPAGGAGLAAPAPLPCLGPIRHRPATRPAPPAIDRTRRFP